ncbi:MAG: CHAT domain-containing protein [candidate division NC10 bacterium]|nr:CHAT domain-containing protein [candidate division NC10 bacterium]
MAMAALDIGTVNTVHSEIDPTPTMTPPVLALYREGEAAFQAGDMRKAREKFQATLEQAGALRDETGIGASLAALGSVHQALQEYPQALESFSAALPYFARTKNLPAEWETLMSIGKVHDQMGNHASAIEAFDRALVIGGTLLGKASEQEKLVILQHRAKALLLKAQAHEKLGHLTEAVESYRQAAADFQIVGNLEMAGIGLEMAATISRKQMRAPRQAATLYAEASALLQAAGKVADATWARLELGWSHYEAGNDQEALAAFTEVIEVAERERLPKFVVYGYEQLGAVFESLGEFEQALTHYQTALQRLQEGDWKGDPTSEPWILVQKGKIYRVLSQHEEAIEHFRQAAVKYREAQEAKGEAEALTQLAEIFYWLGDGKATIQYYKQALELYKAAGDLPKQVEALAALQELGLLGGGMSSIEIHEYLVEGGKLVEELVKKEQKLMASVWGKASQDKPSMEEAQQLLEEWQKTVPVEYRMAIGTFAQKMGKVQLEITRELQAAIDMFNLAFVYHASLPVNRDTTIEKAKDLYWLAEAFRQKGKLNSALVLFRGLERMVRPLRTPEIHHVYAGLARTYADLGDTDNAVHSYKEGLATLESTQGQQVTEEIKMDVLEGALWAYRGFVPLLLDLYRKTKEERYLHEAFHYHERGRARAFLELLSKARITRLGGEVGELAAKEEEIRRQITRIHHQLRAPKLDETEEAHLLDQLDHLRESWHTLQREAAQQSPRYAQLISPRIVTVAEVQSVLDDDAVLLEYSTGPERSILWAITKDQAHAYTLPGREVVPTLEAYLKTLREPLMAVDEVSRHVRLGQQLYEGLVWPAEQQLRGKKHLIIVPDGLLYYLPFETLILPDSQGRAKAPESLAEVPYLVKQFQVTYVPSASILVTQYREQSSRDRKTQLPLAAFGDPVYGEARFTADPDSETGQVTHLKLRGILLNRLEFSGDEVRRIAQIWGIPLDSAHINLRDRATVERVRELDLSQYRLLHFATHAVLGDEVRWATQPALVLSHGRGEKGNTYGLLPMTDILGLKLNAELVVLSACNTGLGELRGGEGIVGLTRAFLYAGASAVMVSLWRVEDQSTSFLMERFYQRLKQGEGKAEALRQAKLEVLHTTVDLKAIGMRQPLSSPFYWAPFILVGAWD